jgi:hypothetical protein
MDGRDNMRLHDLVLLRTSGQEKLTTLPRAQMLLFDVSLLCTGPTPFRSNMHPLLLPPTHNTLH